MTKEIKIYETRDGKQFKTKKAAENHERKIAVEKVLSNLKMDKQEVTDNLKAISNRFPIINRWLKLEGDWTKWQLNHIDMIKFELFDESSKDTVYVMEYEDWGNLKEKELFKVTGEDFASPTLHCDNDYVVDRVEDVSNVKRKVFYAYKYSWEERILKKLQSNEHLDEYEIREVTFSFPEVHREEGEDRRWSKSILSVLDIMGELYAIEWEQGLTENQDNQFYEQPYLVELKTEEVVVKTIKTIIIKK